MPCLQQHSTLLQHFHPQISIVRLDLWYTITCRTSANEFLVFKSANDNYEDLSYMDDFEFALPSPLSPLELDLASPISSGSSRGAEDFFDDMTVDSIIPDYDFYTSPATACEPSTLVSILNLSI
jgi:hypothetical protein